MALKDLSPPQMLHVSAAWLDPARDRPRIEKLGRVAPLLADLTKAHEDVRTAHSKEKKGATELADIQARQLEVDRLHDRKARGGWYVLTGFADLSDDPDQAAFYLELRDAIYANGLRFITGSYGNQAGEAELTRSRLTTGRRMALKALPTPGGSLLKSMLAWFAAADELGQLEAQRAKLEAEAKPQGDRPQGGQLRARNRWIKVTRAILQMLELEEVDEETERELLAPLHRALEKAERRQAIGGGADEEVDEAEGGAEAKGSAGG